MAELGPFTLEVPVEAPTQGPFEVLTISPNNRSISFQIEGVEKMRISPDGFYVDGVKVNDDPSRIYEAAAAFFWNNRDSVDRQPKRILDGSGQ